MRDSLYSLRTVFTALLLMFVYSSKAQTKIPYLMISEMQVDDAFEHLQSFLLEKDYFIKTMDSRQRFVQFKIVSKEKGLFKADRRYIVNLFVVKNGDSASKIRLQINSEKLEWNGEVGNAVYYYKDEGLLKDSDTLYDDVIAELKQFYDAI